LGAPFASRAASAADGLAAGTAGPGSFTDANASATFAAMSGNGGTGCICCASGEIALPGAVLSRPAAFKTSFKEPRRELRGCGPAAALDMGGSSKMSMGIDRTYAQAAPHPFPAAQSREGKDGFTRSHVCEQFRRPVSFLGASCGSFVARSRRSHEICIF
jgi:hypothetical protein